MPYNDSTFPVTGKNARAAVSGEEERSEGYFFHVNVARRILAEKYIGLGRIRTSPCGHGSGDTPLNAGKYFIHAIDAKQRTQRNAPTSTFVAFFFECSNRYSGCIVVC